MPAPPCLPPREVTRPKVPPPPNACDTHAHVFGPANRFAYADDRSSVSYTHLTLPTICSV